MPSPAAIRPWDPAADEKADQSTADGLARLGDHEFLACGGEQTGEFYRRALAKELNHVRANLGLGEWLAYHQKYTEALPYVEKAVQLAAADSQERVHAEAILRFVKPRAIRSHESRPAAEPAAQAEDAWELRADEFWLRINYEDGQGGKQRFDLKLSAPKSPAKHKGEPLTLEQARKLIRAIRTRTSAMFDLFPTVKCTDLPCPCFLVTYGVGPGDKVPDDMQQNIAYPAYWVYPLLRELDRLINAGPAAKALAELKAKIEDVCPELELAERFRKADDLALLVQYHGQRGEKGEPIDLLLYGGRQPGMAMPKNTAKPDPAQVDRLVERMVVGGVFSKAGDITDKKWPAPPAAPCYTLTLVGPRQLYLNMGWRIDLVNNSGWLSNCVRGGPAGAAVNKFLASLEPLKRQWLQENQKAARAAIAIEPPIAAPATQGEMPRPEVGPDLKELGKFLAIREQAATLAELAAKAKPDFTFGDGGRDMMWIDGKGTAAPSFRLEHAFVYQPAGRPASFVLLRSLHESGPADDPWTFAATLGMSGAAKLYDEQPMYDGGSGDYAIVKSHGPDGAVLYEIGWETGFGANWFKERRLFALRSGGRWQFVGEGLAESYDKMGYCQAATTSVGARVEWTGRADAPVRIHFMATAISSEWASSDMLQADPTAGDKMRDDLENRLDWVLDGQLPAAPRKVTGRPYMLARSGDTFDKVVRHLASWTSRRQDDAPRIEAAWKRELTRLNPNLPAGNILEGQRINLPTDAGMAELLNAAKPVKQPPSRASNR